MSIHYVEVEKEERDSIVEEALDMRKRRQALSHREETPDLVLIQPIRCLSWVSSSVLFSVWMLVENCLIVVVFVFAVNQWRFLFRDHYFKLTLTFGFCISDGSMLVKAFLQCTDIRLHVSPRGRVLGAESTCQSTVTETSSRTSPSPAALWVWARPQCWAAAPAHPCHRWSSLSQQFCPNPAFNLR